jgi:uncharacterized protein YcfJ
MIILRERFYREKVPNNIAMKARKEGVVQQDSNGDWRIISFKQNPPEYWDAHYDSKEDAEKALSAYHAQKHFSSYDGISDDDLDDEIYRRAVKKYNRRTKFWKILGGSLLGAGTGYLIGRDARPLFYKDWSGITRLNLFKPLQGHPIPNSIIGGLVGGVLGAASGNGDDFMYSERFRRILRKEYDKAYGSRPHLTRSDDDEQRYYSSYDNVRDEDLDQEIYRRAMKRARRKALIRGAIFGGLGGLATGLWKGRGPGLLSILGGVAGAVGSIGIGAARNAFRADLSNRDFVKALKEEYNKAYKVKPPRQLGPIQQSQKYGSGTNGVVEEYDEDN